MSWRENDSWNEVGCKWKGTTKLPSTGREKNIKLHKLREKPTTKDQLQKGKLQIDGERETQYLSCDKYFAPKCCETRFIEGYTAKGVSVENITATGSREMVPCVEQA